MLDLSAIEDIRTMMKESMLKDRSILDGVRNEVKILKNEVKSIRPRTTSSVSIVGTDGGNNSLKFDPFVVHVIRVVDSYNKQYYMDVVTPTTPIRELDNKISRGGQGYDALKEMMDYLGVKSISELTPMINETPPGDPVKPSWVSVYREIVEWATLFSLIRDKNKMGDTLIIFDGLLRSKIFSKDYFKRLREGIEESINEQFKITRRHIYIVGIAKHSKVMDRYKLAMHLEGILRENRACYVEIPRELEVKAYLWAEYAKDQDVEGREANKFVAGKMFFVKFGTSKDDPLWIVDVFLPQVKDSQIVMGSLLADAQNGFPVPFYPLTLQKAHENAALVDFDMDVIQNEILDAIREALKDESEKIDSFLIRTKDFSSARYG